MTSLFYLLIYSIITPALSFIIGGCIGPKSVLERHLNPAQKAELRKLVHTMFDGTNSEQNSVYKATQLGANDHDLKRLVEDYLDRALRSGIVSQGKLPTKAITPPSYPPKVRRYPQRITYERPFWPNSSLLRTRTAMAARPDRYSRFEYLPEQYGK
ncbi:hypothetical protein ANCDUO_03623 [Ancylostoma duodenale]|uniref:Uncharacterized protein n=1 Tax=Ancylostoma duodenale TaxID=51022 RepID=A0A0C2DTC1_9BILA|nr:hypothetical protein ANCDUO_03623 [Ancylostoma duodenale]